MFRVHEEFPAHPKVEKLESLSKDGASWCGAMGLWLAMGCDCRARLTDGHFTEARMRKVCGNAARYADALVDAKLWHRTAEGYVFHDWADVQETKEQVQSRMAKDRDRKRGGKGAESKADSERIPDGIPGGVQTDSVTPSHPLPSQSFPSPPGPTANAVVATPRRVAAPPTLELRNNDPLPRKRKPPRDATARQIATAAALEEYTLGYVERYGVEPARNAKSNGQAGNFTDRIPHDDVRMTVRAYLRSNNARYLASGHAWGTLLMDAEKLHTEARTGRAGTSHEAREADKREGRGNEARDVFSGLRDKPLGVKHGNQITG